MVNLGLVPLSIKAGDIKDKKEFLDSQPQGKIDAAKFIDYINKVGKMSDINLLWTDFIKVNPQVKSSIKDVEKYINQDGKTYHFDKKYQTQDFTNVNINTFTPSNYLTDMGGFIDDSKEPDINNFIYNYAKETSVEIGIITIPKLEENITIEDYAQAQFNRIGIGKSSSNNGVLIVVSMQDRKWRIHTGYGVEGLLPDITCNHIGRDVLTGNFKKGDYYAGIMGSLEEIKSIINKNPDDIKKFQKEESDKAAKATSEALQLFGEIALILAMATVLSILFYKRRKNRKEMLAEIESKLKEIDKIKRLAKLSGQSEVDKLYENFMSVVKSKIQEVNNVPKTKEGLEKLSGLHDEISKVYNKWANSYNSLQKVLGSVSNHNSKKILNNIDNGLKLYNQLKNTYGVDYAFDATKLKSDATKLDSLIGNLEATCAVSLAGALAMLSQYDSIVSNISTSVSSVSAVLSKYNTAKEKTDNWSKLADAAMDDMYRYKSWARSGEEQEVKDKIKSYSAISGDKKDLIKLNSKLDSLISDIDSMRRTWKKRKDDEEEKKRRAAAAATAAIAAEEESRRSSYSSSSSSSSSSFDGFGGGSSGGGGASGSW